MRTYKSKLYTVLKTLVTYIGRYRPSLEANMNASQIAALSSCLTCAVSLLDLIDQDVLPNEA